MTKITNEFTELQLAWIEELLNGNLPQGQFRLQGEEGYCCLGVACKVTERIKPEIHLNILPGWGRLAGHSLSSQLPIRKALNLRGSDGEFKRGLICPEKFLGREEFPDTEKVQYFLNLTQLNDDLRWSFRQIGGWIYRNPWQVFTNFEEPE